MSETTQQPMRRGGVVLCGGKSVRMGRDKATLPIGGELMLQRVVRLLAASVERVVVVAAAGQTPPALPEGIRVVHDEQPEQGPLQGLSVGLQALAGQCDAAYATSCDAPFLNPGWVEAMFSRLDREYDAVVAVHEGRPQPLAAVYRTTLGAEAQRLLDAGRRRPVDLMSDDRTKWIDAEALRAVDPDLGSLRNVNRPEEYAQALRELEPQR